MSCSKLLGSHRQWKMLTWVWHLEATLSPGLVAAAVAFSPQRVPAGSPPCSAASLGAGGCHQTQPGASPHGPGHRRAHTPAPVETVLEPTHGKDMSSSLAGKQFRESNSVLPLRWLQVGAPLGVRALLRDAADAGILVERFSSHLSWAHTTAWSAMVETSSQEQKQWGCFQPHWKHQK